MTRRSAVAQFAALAALLAAVFAARAQTETPAAAPAPLAPSFYLSSSPGVPIAGNPVTLTVAPQNFEAASTTFTWFRDGVVLPAASGPGKRTIVITTDPDESETTTIRVVADPGPGFLVGDATLVISTLPNPEVLEEARRSAAADFTLEVSDPSPAPRTPIEVRVVTFAFDRGLASYRWTVNGVVQTQSSGRGRSILALQAGREGEATTIGVVVSTPSGEVRQKSIVIRPVSSPLYWWADTGVPYWYRGKALPTVNSRVTVLAVPNAALTDGLAYRWRFNDNAVPASSGAGRNTFSFALTLPVSETASVVITDADGTLSKTAEVAIEPVDHGAGIYEVRPLRGIVFERELRSFAGAAGEPYDFIAVPFFFPREREKGLEYRWALNGEVIGGEVREPWLFTLESTGGETSANQLRVEVADPQRTGERTSASFQANLR